MYKIPHEKYTYLTALFGVELALIFFSAAIVSAIDLQAPVAYFELFASLGLKTLLIFCGAAFLPGIARMLVPKNQS